MKPTVHDIARSAGVSLATVDRVLNDRPGVRAVTREKVAHAIAELGYVRDLAAANLAKGRTYSFCFVLPANDNSFMIRLRAEVQGAIRRSALERSRIEIVEVPAFDAAALVAARPGESCARSTPACRYHRARRSRGEASCRGKVRQGRRTGSWPFCAE